MELLCRKNSFQQYIYVSMKDKEKILFITCEKKKILTLSSL